MAFGNCGLIEVDFEKLGSLAQHNSAGFVIQPEAVSYASGGLATVDRLTVGHSRLRDEAVGWYSVGLAAEPVQCAWSARLGKGHLLVASIARALDVIPVEVPGGISEEIYSITPVSPKSRRFEHLLKWQVQWQHLILQFGEQFDLVFAACVSAHETTSHVLTLSGLIRETPTCL